MLKLTLALGFVRWRYFKNHEENLLARCEGAIPYSSEALRQDLQRVRAAWNERQANRDRHAMEAN
jgi:hypothetical protein